MKLPVIAFVGLVCGVAAVRGQGTQPLVAIHDSELTRALEFMPATGSTPTGPGTTSNQWWLVNWHYFVMPNSVEEALRSDGTAFTVLGDANIGAGQLLDSNGLPSYPILISLASEAVDEGEIAQLTNYVAAGGTLLVGSSAFTRMTNGVSRGDFAIANAMGVHMVSASLENWAANLTFSKSAALPMVAHIPGGVLDWDMAVSSDEVPWGTWPSYELSVGHLIWRVQTTNALVIAQGDANPYLLTSSFGKGTFIYLAALEPFLGHGGNAPGMYAYGILRKAIEGAFASLNLPIPKLSPWPFAYDAALSVRHDFDDLQDQISSIEASAHFEYTNGAKGDYHFCTGTLRVEMTNSPVVIAGLRSAVNYFGATIGPENGGLANPNNPSLPLASYDHWHWGADEALDMAPSNLNGYASGTAYAFASISNSFLDIEGWLAGLTNGLRLTVAPNFNSTREESYQIEQQLGVNSSGEQKLGPFPSWVLSTQTPDQRYAFISLPTSEWFVTTPQVVQTMENGLTSTTLHQLVDAYYNWGGLINLYSHSSSSGNGIAGSLAGDYVIYSMSKSRIWPANAADIYSWWLARSNAQVSATYSTNGNYSVVDFVVSGASDPGTAVEVLAPRPSVCGLQVWTNGVLAGTNNYRTKGPVIKVLVGTTVTNAQISYLPNPEVQTNFFLGNEGSQLSVSAPGTLTNALPGAGSVLTATLVGGTADGTLSLSNNGGFGYVPVTNFLGMDSFTYQVSDGVSTSAVARTIIDVVTPGDLFYDNFSRPTNSDPLAPWVQELGQWSISGGQLLGINPDPGTFSDCYVAGNWTNYSVQSQVQFPATAFAGGLDGRVNLASGAKYTVNVYPNGFPGMGTNSLMMLWKFHSWQILSSAPMALVTLPQQVGTNWHTLKITFRGNEIVVYFDGNQIIDVTDNNFDGLLPYPGGGIAAHFFSYMTPFVMAFQNMEVSTAPVAANNSYTAVQNRRLAVAAPGILANDAPGLGTNLTAVLLNGTTNGVLNLNSNGGFSYAPATNYVGTDAFTYQAFDGVSSSAVAVVTITVISNSPPVANGDTYTYIINTPLTVAAPGVLANDTDAAGDSLSAALVTGPAWGTVLLSTNGGFTYTPGTNFNGSDSFTYVDVDGSVTSDVATVTLTDPSAESLFYDDFPGTNLSPWVVESGNWSVANGELEGGPNPTSSYGFVYLTNNWGDYAVEGKFRFGLGAYGGGLGGRLNQTSGAQYAGWIYPIGNDFNLVKFTAWNAPTFLATLSVPPLGTNWHRLKLAFRGNEIAAYLDGSMLISVTDSALPALANGGIATELYTDNTPFEMSVKNIIVDTLVTPDSYYMNQNGSLTVNAPGVLGNDTGVYSTNLTALLVSGPSHGILSLNNNGGFNYIPATNFAGLDSFVYQASDGQTNLGAAIVTIGVSGTSSGPTLPNQANLTINELSALLVTNTATDPASPPEVLTYTLVSPPSGASIDANGIITWTPSQAQAPSTNTITTIVSDNGTPSLSATNSFTVVIDDLNTPPVLPAQTNRTIVGLAPLVVTNTASEADIGVTSQGYALVNAPANAGIDTNGIIRWTPVMAQVPSTNVFTTVVTNYDPNAVNGQSLSATNSFTVVVAAIHNGPSLPAQPNLTLNQLSTVVVTNTASDSDIPTLALSYQLVSPPTGASIDTNGIITWTPSQAQAPSVNVLMTVVSDNGTPSLSATNSFTVVIDDLNTPPVLPAQTNRTIVGLAPLVVTNTASEADIGVTSQGYALVNAPANAGIDTNGIIRWTPVMAQVPSTNVFTTVVTNYDPNAVNGQSLSATNSFTVVVAAIHNGPSLPAQPNLTLNQLSTVVVTNTASDSDIPTLALSYRLVSPPTGASIDANGIITWTPSQAQAPSVNVLMTVVSDNGTPSLSATNSFTVVIDDLNTPPVLPAQTNRTIVGLAPLVVTNTASEADIGVTSQGYALVNAPANAGIDTNGIIRWTPVMAQVPSTNVFTTVVTNYDPNAVNGQSLSATNSFTVVVAAIHNGPSLPAQPNLTLNQLSTVVVTNTASDSDIPTLALSYQLVSPPTGASIDANGIITWTPSQAQAPSVNVLMTVVSDNGTPSLSATNSFTVVIDDLNTPPVLPAQTNRTIVGLAPLVVTNTASEADIGVTSQGYALVNAPANAGIDTNGIIRWTPVMAQVPSTNVFTTVVTNYDPNAVNGQSLSATNSFTVVVAAIHNGPSLPAQPNLTLNQLSTVVVTNTASDSDIPTLALSYQLVSPPTGASIDANGIITWTPSQAQAPSVNVLMTVVSDNGTPSLSATNSFTVVIDDLNTPPVLPAQTNRTIVGLAPLVVTNTASEADIGVTSQGYALVNAPANAGIDTNGIIRWTPVMAQVPSTNVFTTVVTNYDPNAVNGQSLSATNSFTVVVAAIHNGPTLPAQNNLTVNELRALVVTNTASDADIPTLGLSYRLVSPPSGASIDASGIIRWTPSQAQAPSTNTITTIVSDNGTPSLSATNSFIVVVNKTNLSFHILSTGVTNGVATITWHSLAGQTYRLQFKNNLTDPSWQAATPDITATSSTSFATNGTAGVPQRFYRVLLLP